jgi:hypothetical protein
MRAESIPGWQALVARLLVAVMLLVSAGPLLHAADGHDIECAPVLQHDCSQHNHALSANDGERALPGVHCAVCHFGRHLRSVVGLGDGVFHLFAASERLVHEPVHVPQAAAVLPLPARAPPSFLG